MEWQPITSRKYLSSGSLCEIQIGGRMFTYSQYSTLPASEVHYHTKSSPANKLCLTIRRSLRFVYLGIGAHWCTAPYMYADLMKQKESTVTMITSPIMQHQTQRFVGEYLNLTFQRLSFKAVVHM